MRVLMLSSWVARGHVGLSAGAPALQLLGHEVTQLPTVILSNHPGFPHVAGRPVPVEQIAAMTEALAANGWLDTHDALLTGYLPTPDHVAFAAGLAERLKRAGARITVDPVLGDAPKGLYLPLPVAEALRESGSARAPRSSGPAVPVFERRFTKEGAVYLWGSFGFAVMALILGRNPLLLLACAVLAATWWARRLARANVEGVSVRRSVPSRATVGRPATLAWTVTRDAPRSALGLKVVDRPGGGSTPRAVEVDVPHLAGGSSATVTTDVAWRQRGQVTLRGPRVTSRFPLGLVRCHVTLPLTDELVVRPAEGRLGPRFRAWLASGPQDPLAMDARARTEEELHGVRAWREGDDPRRVHARTSARRGEPIVTEWRGAQGQEITLVLGTGGASADFERAVRAAATIWRALLASGRPVRLVLDRGSAGVTRRRDGAVARPLAQGLDALALVTRGGRRPRAALKARPPRPGTAVVYVTSRDEPGLSDGLKRLVGRHGRALVVPGEGAADLAPFVEGVA